MGKIAKILGYLTVWVLLIGCVVFLSLKVRAHQEALVVSAVEISVVDSAQRCNLVTVEMVEKMLREAKIAPLGVAVKDLQLSFIEQTISRNGFVERVVTYVDYHGVLSIDVSQRSAVARILFDGYNSYITHDGFLFDAPLTAALYTSVVTGDYKPLFPPKYSGSIERSLESQLEKLEREIERVEREKYPLHLRERVNNEDRRSVRRRYINRSMLESKEDFAQRVEALREENRKLRETYAYRQKVIDGEMAKFDREQERYREAQKKLQKKCDDIYNLITFVEMVDSDPFWRAEIVQINITADHNGDMRATLSVRSGGYIVTIGSLSSDRNGMRQKLNRLRAFYNDALPRVGWDRYREINIEFDNQVVCKR